MAVSFQVLDLTQRKSRNRVGWFFRHEGDKMRNIPMLFDDDRWGQCTEAIVAEDDGNIVGIVTLASRGIDNSRRPTIDTLYVPKIHRKKGLGYLLFEQGLRRLIAVAGDSKVFCQLQSSVMLHLVVKLPEDLGSHLEVQEDFQFGDLAEDFEDLEQDLPG